MAYVDRYDAAFGIFVSRFMRNNVHTNIRGKVVGVNYKGPTIDVQPMAYTEFPNGVVDRYPIIYDVPVHLPSGAGGKARLTMPIKAGDFVGLSFSERNEGDNNDQNTHQLFAGWAVTQIFTDGNSKAIDPENVVLENDKAILTQRPNGDTLIENPGVDVQYLADGNVKIDNGSGSLTISPSGEIGGKNGAGSFKLDSSGALLCNGAKITPTGRIITSEGVDLDDFYNWVISHTHGGVERGDGNTNPPTR